MKVIKISAIWCPSCIIMTNVINKIKKEKLIEEKNNLLKKLIDSNILQEEKKVMEERLKEISIALTKIK